MYVLNQGIKSSTRVFSMYPLLTLFRRELLLFDIVVYSSFNIRVNLDQYFSQSGLIFQPIWFNIWANFVQYFSQSNSIFDKIWFNISANLVQYFSQSGSIRQPIWFIISANLVQYFSQSGSIAAKPRRDIFPFQQNALTIY